MNVGDRIKQRLADLGMSQSELARRVGINQSTVAALLTGRSRSSGHLHSIARSLETTTSFLVGETDDPDDNAPPPPLKLAVQSFMLPVTLPSEDALAAAYRGLLIASRRMNEDELARELAKRLPTMLRVSSGVIAGQWSDGSAAPDAGEQGQEIVRPEAQRARNR